MVSWGLQVPLAPERALVWWQDDAFRFRCIETTYTCVFVFSCVHSLRARKHPANRQPPTTITTLHYSKKFLMCAGATGNEYPPTPASIIPTI